MGIITVDKLNMRTNINFWIVTSKKSPQEKRKIPKPKKSSKYIKKYIYNYK